mmetsp:Transcript_46897/g.118173  ORF Transcript_46897/g.118173 Transcript_46897/m.118173 type:complete len:499 (-) Transcript_46897:1516-3012(-)
MIFELNKKVHWFFLRKKLQRWVGQSNHHSPNAQLWHQSIQVKRQGALPSEFPLLPLALLRFSVLEHVAVNCKMKSGSPLWAARLAAALLLGLGCHIERQLVGGLADAHHRVLLERALDQHLTDLSGHLLLQVAPQRAGAIHRVPSLLDGQLGARLLQLQVDVLLSQAFGDVGELQVHNARQLLLGEGAEHHDVVQPVEELGPEVLANRAHNRALHAVAQHTRVAGPLHHELRAQVGGHDDDRVGEVHGAALRVGEAAVVQHLQQHVEHVGVRLLHLVKEDDAVRLAPHRLGQLPTLVMPDVAGRRADQARHRVLLHVLGHVDAHHVLLVIKQHFRQRLGELRLANASGAQKQEGAHGLVLLPQAGARAQHCLRHGVHRLALPNHSLVQELGQLQQPLLLALAELAHRDARPAAHHLRDLLGPHVLHQQRAGLRLHSRQLRVDGLQLGQHLVLEARHVGQVAPPLRLRDGHLGVLQVLFHFAQLVHSRLLPLVLRAQPH